MARDRLDLLDKLRWPGHGTARPTRRPLVQLPHRRGARYPRTDMTETTRGHNVITQTIFKSLNAMAKVCIPRVGNLRA